LLSGLLLAGCVRQPQPSAELTQARELPDCRHEDTVRFQTDLPTATVTAVKREFAGAVADVAGALGLPVPQETPAFSLHRARQDGRSPLRAIDGQVLPQADGVVFLAVREELGDRDREVIRHEAVHWFLLHGFWIHGPDGSRRPGVPRWLDEGLATAFETGPTGTDDNPARRQQFERLASPRWRALIGLRHTLDLRRDERMTSADYARSWAICAYLLRRQPEQLRELLRRRQAWCQKPPRLPDLAAHERELVPQCRREFERVVLNGESLATWFGRVREGTAPAAVGPGPATSP
jgi:hypothetical protein